MITRSTELFRTILWRWPLTSTRSAASTTIMAAERIGRHARALEIEPRFVDVAIRRWQAFTRRDALRAECGLTFDEIAAHATASKRARAPSEDQGEQQ